MEAEYRELISNLERGLTTTAGTNDPKLIARSRTGVRRRYGDIQVKVTETAIEFWPSQDIEAALALAAGSDQQVLMVAGARFGNCVLTLPRPARRRP